MCMCTNLYCISYCSCIKMHCVVGISVISRPRIRMQPSAWRAPGQSTVGLLKVGCYLYFFIVEGCFPLCLMRRCMQLRTTISAQNDDPYAAFAACPVNQNCLDFYIGRVTEVQAVRRCKASYRTRFRIVRWCVLMLPP